MKDVVAVLKVSLENSLREGLRKNCGHFLKGLPFTKCMIQNMGVMEKKGD